MEVMVGVGAFQLGLAAVLWMRRSHPSVAWASAASLAATLALLEGADARVAVLEVFRGDPAALPLDALVRLNARDAVPELSQRLKDLEAADIVRRTASPLSTARLTSVWASGTVRLTTISMSSRLSN
jgi:hypothetical protein